MASNGRRLETWPGTAAGIPPSRPFTTGTMLSTTGRPVEPSRPPTMGRLDRPRSGSRALSTRTRVFVAVGTACMVLRSMDTLASDFMTSILRSDLPEPSRFGRMSIEPPSETACER